MGFIFILLTILAGIYIGWGIGANDAANCVGADIGSRRMSLSQGIIITCIFSLLGALLLGSHVIKTVGRGIVPLDKLNPAVSLAIALAACFAGGSWLLLSSWLGLPVSTTHSIVGAVAGAGLAFGAEVIWKKIFDIVIAWVATPIGSGIIAYILYRPFRRLFFSLVPPRYESQFITATIFLTSIYMAFTWGANDVANATGVIVGAGIMAPTLATLIGAGAIILGIVTMGYKVIQTVGFGITRLAPMMTIVVEIASSINIHLYTILGIPVSTSHSIVGAVVGVGMIKGIRAIDKKTIKNIIFAWSFTPLISGTISFLLMKIIMFFGLIR